MRNFGKERFPESRELPSPNVKIPFLNDLKAAAILLVVVQHSMSFGKQYFAASALYLNAITFLQFINVPLFFMISGYLCHRQPILPYYRKKTFQIIIPFLVFTTAKLLFNLFDGSFAHSASVWGEIVSAYIIGEYYWFSYALFFMSILAPLLWKLQNKKWVLPAILISLLALNLCFYTVLPKPGVFQCINTLVFFPWFLLGFIVKQYDLLHMKNRYPACILCGIASLAVFIVCVVLFPYRNTCYYLFNLSVSVSASYLLTVLFRAIRVGRKCSALVSKYSYQIFLLDSFVKIGLFYLVNRFLHITVVSVFLIAFCNVALSVVLCVIGSKSKVISMVLGIKKERSS